MLLHQVFNQMYNLHSLFQDFYSYFYARDFLQRQMLSLSVLLFIKEWVLQFFMAETTTLGIFDTIFVFKV